MVSMKNRKALLNTVIAGVLSVNFIPTVLAQSVFSFEHAFTMPTQGLPESVAIGDVNNDGLNDLVVVNNSFSNLMYRNHVLIYEQLENATLNLAAALEYTDSLSSDRGVELMDLDGDDDQEVVVGYFGNVSIVNYQNGAYVMTKSSGGEGNRVLEAIDLNRDGFKDLVGLHISQGINVYMSNTEGGLIFDQVIDIPNASGGDDIEIADLNGNNIDDMAVVNGGTSFFSNLSVYEGDGTGGFLGRTNYQLGGFELTNNGAIADINNDGRKDVLLSRRYADPNHLWAYKQSIFGDLDPVQMLSSGAGAVVVESADINQDGLDDVVLLHENSEGSFLGYHLQSESGLQDEVFIALPQPSRYEEESLALGDLNNDGCTDTAIADSNQGVVVLYGEGCTREADLSVSLRARRDIAVVAAQHLSGESVTNAVLNIHFASSEPISVGLSQGPACASILVQQNEVRYECNVGNMMQGDTEAARFKWSTTGSVSIEAQVDSELKDPDLSNNETVFVSLDR